MNGKQCKKKKRKKFPDLPLNRIYMCSACWSIPYDTTFILFYISRLQLSNSHLISTLYKTLNLPAFFTVLDESLFDERFQKSICPAVVDFNVNYCSVLLHIQRITDSPG